MSLIRQAIVDLNTLTRLEEQSLVDTVVNYFNRQTDHASIRDGIIARYGVGIKPVEDGVTEGGAVETYTKRGFEEQVDAGLIEAISSGFGFKVVNALATLFTERGQKYSYTHDTVEDVESAEELINEQRELGGYNTTVVAADKLSIQCGSSAVLLSVSQGHLTYRKFSPAEVSVFFPETIEDDGASRLVDQSDLEDAYCVVIRLSQVDAMTWNYLAIFGRSDIYPNGRYVTFQSSSGVTDIPDQGAPEAHDFEMGGGIANPLTWYGNQYPDERLPEYPLAIIKSNIAESGLVMPVSTSLYNDAIEFDIAASHLLSTSQDSARGTTVISRNEAGRNHPLPRTINGVVALDAGVTLEHVSHDSSASVNAMQVLKDLEIEMAAGYSVPDFMVGSEDHALEASSGIALQVKTRPLKKEREARVEANRPVVGRIFQIEKILIELFIEGDQGAINLLRECDQTWDAGELKLPENKKEAAERIISLMDKGILDTIAALREYYQLSTDEEAIDMYEKMANRAKEYPSLVQEPEMPKKVGLPLRGNRATDSAINRANNGQNNVR